MIISEEEIKELANHICVSNGMFGMKDKIAKDIQNFEYLQKIEDPDFLGYLYYDFENDKEEFVGKEELRKKIQTT